MLLFLILSIWLGVGESKNVTTNLQSSNIVLYSSSNTALNSSSYIYTFNSAFNGTPKVIFGLSQVETRLPGYFYSKYWVTASNISSSGFNLSATSGGLASNLYQLKVSVLAFYNQSYLDMAQHSIVGVLYT